MLCYTHATFLVNNSLDFEFRNAMDSRSSATVWQFEATTSCCHAEIYILGYKYIKKNGMPFEANFKYINT